jgi:predicted nucleic acid binding AN1-type Zn finger protein
MPSKKLKCIICQKKHLITFQCHCCNEIFCINHRFPELHACQYDFNNKDNLKEKLQKIEPIKIDKI